MHNTSIYIYIYILDKKNSCMLNDDTTFGYVLISTHFLRDFFYIYIFFKDKKSSCTLKEKRFIQNYALLKIKDNFLENKLY